MAVRKRPQFLAGCWQEVLVRQLMDLSSGLLECPHDTAAGLSQTDGSERERKNKR